MSKCTQDVSGFGMTAGREREPFEADHCVASPVGEPVITGDDGANLVSGGERSRCIGDAARGSDEELICCENEFSTECILRSRIGYANQPPAPFHFGMERFVGIQRPKRLKVLG